MSPLLPNDGSTPFENLHVVGDTVSAGAGIALVTKRALKLANKITNK
jgi:phytoene dehydrogenase-like protein